MMVVLVAMSDPPFGYNHRSLLCDTCTGVRCHSRYSTGGYWRSSVSQPLMQEEEAPGDHQQARPAVASLKLLWFYGELTFNLFLLDSVCLSPLRLNRNYDSVCK